MKQLIQINAAIIYELNLSKSKVKTTYKNTMYKVGDFVRIKETNIFNKKSEGTYKDEIYEIKNVNGKNIILDNGKTIKYDLLQKVSKPIKTEEPKPKKNIIKTAKKEYKNELLIKEDVIPENIIETKRIKKPNSRYL